MLVGELGGLIKQRVVVPVLCTLVFDSATVVWSLEKWFWLEQAALRPDLCCAVQARDGGRVSVPTPWLQAPLAPGTQAPAWCLAQLILGDGGLTTVLS